MPAPEHDAIPGGDSGERSIGAPPGELRGRPVDNLGELVGIEYLGDPARSDGHVRARVEIGERIRQPYGIVHGGAYATIAESMCSIGTAAGVKDEGMIAMGQSSQASFLRPAREGTLHAEARARHRGRSTWIWDCEISDDEGRLCAMVRMTVAVRPAPSSG